MEVANVVRATLGQRNDVIDSELGFSISLAASFALVAITLKDVLPDHIRNINALRFAHWPHLVSIESDPAWNLWQHQQADQDKTQAQSYEL